MYKVTLFILGSMFDPTAETYLQDELPLDEVVLLALRCSVGYMMEEV